MAALGVLETSACLGNRAADAAARRCLPMSQETLEEEDRHPGAQATKEASDSVTGGKVGEPVDLVRDQ
ncbi:hypothetical protein OIU91_04830 [Streptomyces sp. NBC_01456]|uniref:hypothetical protein n=1 Tax=unclassified Streptomyces TaxID=2593676 RepID=UPI002E34E970|nr:MULTISPECIES: hypothetical protein [unclassified Streptomyces]